MKIQIVLGFIFFIIAGIAANMFFFKFTTMTFIGMMLVALIILIIIGTFVGKANRRRRGEEGEPDAFIFPDGAAKKMKKMDLGIQYEASVISSALLMLGIVLFLIYFTFFTSSSWIMKGLIIFNSVCGLGLMGGMLITYYQQLVSYRESTKFLHQYAQSQQQPQRQRQARRQPQQPVYRQAPAEDSGFAEEDYYPEEQQYYNNNMKGGRYNG